MSGFFITERETEDWLVSEARDITLPDGTRHVVRGFRLTWRDVDMLKRIPPYTEAKLLELALHSQKETGRPLDQSFRNVVAYVMQQVKKRPL